MTGMELEERVEWVEEEKTLSQVEARVARAKLCEVLLKQEEEMTGDSDVVLVSNSTLSTEVIGLYCFIG